MEQYITSQGGHCKVGAGIQIPVTEWRLKKHAVLADATTSTGQRRKSILTTGDFSYNAPWDLSQTPESIGLVEGAEIPDIRLFLGSSGLMYGPFAGIIESAELVNDPTKDVVRLVITGYSQGSVPGPVAAL